MVETNDLVEKLNDPQGDISEPWNLPKSIVTVIEVYEAEVVEDAGDYYRVEFADPEDGGIVESLILKERFQMLPYNMDDELGFGIVTYRLQDQDKVFAGAWPLASYWHNSLRDDP